jgi:hypothetical protein
MFRNLERSQMKPVEEGEAAKRLISGAIPLLVLLVAESV